MAEITSLDLADSRRLKRALEETRREFARVAATPGSGGFTIKQAERRVALIIELESDERLLEKLTAELRSHHGI